MPTRSTTGPGAPGRLASFEWYRSLSGNGRAAFWSSFAGWALDSYDYQVFPFALVAIAAAFHLSRGQAGLVATVTLVVSAFGGMLAGVLADRIGRVRTLMLTIAVYSVFTFLSGMAQSFPQLLTFRALQGLGFGGEWAAGAILVAELAEPAQRGRALGWIQSAWAVGWGLANLAFIVVYSLAGPALGWRILFWLGILPSLLLLYIRHSVRDSQVYIDTAAARNRGDPAALEQGAGRSPLRQIFARDLIGRTFWASMLATGAQGGYYSIFTWLPTYLKVTRHLSVLGTGGHLFIVIGGAFLGYISSGYINDWIGRRGTFAGYSVLAGVAVVLFALLPAGAVAFLPPLSFVLGFCASGLFSGFGSFLAEIYPSRARGAGQGFCYNSGRAIGAVFPTAIGFLSLSFGLGGALAFGAFGYALCLLSLLFLPETRGKELVAVS